MDILMSLSPRRSKGPGQRLAERPLDERSAMRKPKQAIPRKERKPCPPDSHPDGFGRRVASNYGRSAIGDSIGFGIAALDGENTRFVPSNENGIWRRTLHAVTGTFVLSTAT